MMKVPSMQNSRLQVPPLSVLFNRRDALRVGSMTLAASVLPGLAPETQAASSFKMNGKAQSVIFLWMGGGVTHIDSFDPKPEAPAEIRGTISAIDTKLPGVQFGEPMTELAKIANVQYSEVFVFRPEGAQQESPGQRPGWQVNHDFQALKGRNTL